MKRYRSSLILALSLLGVSACVYLAQVFIFHDPRSTFFYMLQDFAFVPIQVLLVSLIVNDVLTRREKLELQNKLNMVIGAFYSEMGGDLLKRFSRFDGNADALCAIVRVGMHWTDRDYATAKQRLLEHRFNIDCRLSPLGELKSVMLEQRSFLLRLLENPNLLEHETFTDLLWAINHLTEELDFRDDFRVLPDSDYAHLAGDLQRAYTLLLIEWLAYVRHLRDDYPYIYSLVVRMNPFDANASPIVR